MSQPDSLTAYFSEPEEVLSWKAIHEGSSGSTLTYLKMGVTIKRKRSSDPKSFCQSEIETGRRRKQRANGVDDVEQCIKRMKCMSLQNVRIPQTKEANPFEIDVGYEGDCEA